MKTIGSYQNDVEGLSSLNMSDYERIFRVYTANQDGMDMNYYNISKMIDMPDNVDGQYISFYTPKGNIPWTIASYNIYGSVKMWWLLALMNKDILDDNRFVIKGGTQIKHLIPEVLGLVYNQITNITVFNGKHY
jgi:hypothetical protein